MIIPRWKSARRIHIDVVLPDMYDPVGRAKMQCPTTHYIAVDSVKRLRQISEHRSLFHKLAEGGRALSAEIVVVEACVWTVICGILHRDKLTQLFSNVRILEIAANFTTSGEVKPPDFLQKLTCLSILGGQFLETGRAKFPHLTTLRLCPLVGSDLEAAQSWELPQLQHLEINFKPRSNFYQSGLAFLRKGWLLLLSLTITTGDYTVELPQDIWALLPNLQYLACRPPPSLLGNGLGIQPDYPLRTLGFLSSVDPIIKREKLMCFIKHMPNLAVVADFHDWENIEFPPALTPADLLEHTCKERYCNICIVDTHTFCIAHNLRYEDRWGRSLEEFKSVHSV